MKRFLLLLLVCSGLIAQAQVYNNEWIDYSKTYYKFKVGATGLYRISQTTLSSLGLGSTPAEQFQLWRNGQEVSLYTSVQTGAMGSSDYIEFWGKMNDGKPDNVLYRNTDYQLNDKWSLQTDTAAFFLTVNPSGSNSRLAPVINDVAGNILSPEPYFMHTAGSYWKLVINAGYAAVVGEYVYSAAYDQGEGWTTGNITPGINMTDQFTSLNVYTGAGAPAATFRINASGNALNPRQIAVKLNGDTIINQEMDFFDYVKATAPVALSEISSGTANIEVINTSAIPTDRMVVAQDELVYPRQFNFGNARNFYFELPANINGNYLEISNFNYNGVAPVLYDLTNGKRYVTDISNPALIKVALLPSGSERKLILVSEDAANVAAVTSFQQRNFVNFNLAANQGNYLIITHPVLLSASGGSNPVDNFRAYRSSVAGGSYNVRVYMIDELVDQFGLGIKKDPLAIRNFIGWARSHFSTAPIKDVFLIGKGVTYDQYRYYESNPDIEKLCLIPTFGNPASDNLLAADPGPDEIPKVPIGRLSVISGDEIAVYLAKLIQYEQTQAFSSPVIEDKAWMKNVVQVVGASDDNLTSILETYMDNYKVIISDTLYGGNVTTFSKTSSNAVEELASSRIKDLFHEGIGLITYFGHSSSSTLAFNLDNPESYDNTGKYPVMFALGCLAGNFFNFNLARFQTKETLSEKFVLADQKGTIAFIASSHFGIVHYLDIINSRIYKAISTTHYGKSIGEIMIEAFTQTFNLTTQNDYYARFHCEEITLHGDPALKLNTFAKPDYVIEDPLVKIAPSLISIAETQFSVNASFMNIGRAVNKNIVVELKRTYPDLTTEVIRRDTIPYLRFIDSLSYSIPVVPTRDKGLNKITITVDADNAVDELYETNNSVTKDVFIFEDEARPVYPVNFAIVNRQNIKLVVSTANPFAVSRQYRMELDTTEFFNSSLKVTQTLNSSGGVFEFNPAVTFTDSTVYYWRVAPVPVSGLPVWNTASFIYLPDYDLGFNQSHFFQQLKSSSHRVYLDSSSRTWKFTPVINNVFIRTGIYPTASPYQADYTLTVNDNLTFGPGCNYNELMINIFDPVTFEPWANPVTAGAGLYGSSNSACGTQRQYNFHYFLKDTLWRRRAQNFLDNVVPDGAYVIIRTNTSPTNSANTYVPVWKSDSTFFGQSTLYNSLKNQGFSNLDLYDTARCFIFVYKKNQQNIFAPRSAFSDNIYDRVLFSVDFPTPDTLGYTRSPLFGPAKQWKQLKWRGTTAPDIIPGDAPTVDVIGVNSAGAETTLLSGLDQTQQDVDLSSISATDYPNIRLSLRNIDSVNLTPYQLRYWRLTYVPVPEGAIAPNIYYTGKDTVDVGEPLSYGVAFKNVSDVPFADSMKVKFAITDKNNVQTIFPIARQKILQPGDTIRIDVPVVTSRFTGHNTVFFNFNPDLDQPEQQLFNNFAFKDLYVRPDSLNPLLDVTFDGVHILNRDIVSSKPDIVVKLKDEAKWLVLDDTSLLNLQVKFPDGSLRRYSFTSDTLQFTPAGQAPNTDNTATLNFRPYFPVDGEYELIVDGKDKSNNTAGSIQYRVSFDVINKPMISNMLNYPNPFTTSTAFVFTITGSEVPQNIKIEIMTITGKIVREITKDELGSLHIGRNITEFKWDGTDQYGQKLGNGIYLYRVVTNLNGKVLDKYKADGDNTDKYFNKGYGKMVLMR
jgi:Peptidase family C25